MITGNEPAFPFEKEVMNTLGSYDLAGLTIRQHYAGLAMQGLLSKQSQNGNSSYIPSGEVIAFSAAAFAVQCADALIKELNKPLT